MELYEKLGLTKDASLEEIRASHRKLAFQYHPDRNAGDVEALEKFKAIQQAYEILSNPSKKAEYDRTGSYGRRSSRERYRDPPPQSSPEPKTTKKGNSIHVTLEVELADLVDGCVKTVKLPLKSLCEKCDTRGYTEWIPCETCSGSGKAFLKQPPFQRFIPCRDCLGTGRAGTVKCEDCGGTCFIVTGEREAKVTVGAGAENNSSILLAGMGDPATKNQKPGDAFVNLAVKQHDFYTRKGCDLHAKCDLCYSDFVLGVEIQLKDLKNNEVILTVPAGTKPGCVLKIPRMGLPDWTHKRKGDIFIETNLQFPTHLTEEYKELLRKLKCLK